MSGTPSHPPAWKGVKVGVKKLGEKKGEEQ
jgi:hypothetical protein